MIPSEEVRPGVHVWTPIPISAETFDAQMRRPAAEPTPLAVDDEPPLTWLEREWTPGELTLGYHVAGAVGVLVGLAAVGITLLATHLDAIALPSIDRPGLSDVVVGVVVGCVLVLVSTESVYGLIVREARRGR